MWVTVHDHKIDYVVCRDLFDVYVIIISTPGYDFL